MVAWTARPLIGEPANVGRNAGRLARLAAQGTLVKLALVTGSSQFKGSVLSGGPNRRKGILAGVLGVFLQVQSPTDCNSFAQGHEVDHAQIAFREAIMFDRRGITPAPRGVPEAEWSWSVR